MVVWIKMGNFLSMITRYVFFVYWLVIAVKYVLLKKTRRPNMCVEHDRNRSCNCEMVC